MNLYYNIPMLNFYIAGAILLIVFTLIAIRIIDSDNKKK